MKSIQIKLRAMSVMIAILFITITSCNNSTENKIENEVDTLSANVNEGVNDVKDDYEEFRDENLVSNVIERNTEELHLLTIALQKGTSRELKEHAKKMSADHKKMDTEMRAYAKSNNYDIKMDDSDFKDGLDDDNAGADWDRKWTNKMVNAHEKLVNKFEKAETRVNDAALKAIMTSNLPTLRNHLDMLNALEEKLEK